MEQAPALETFIQEYRLSFPIAADKSPGRIPATMRAFEQRYYDPIAGRFLSVDPVVTDANTGKGFGLYTYVSNNPYSKVDPDGREEKFKQGDSLDWRDQSTGLPGGKVAG